jgi:hypothetical protein
MDTLYQANYQEYTPKLIFHIRVSFDNPKLSRLRARAFDSESIVFVCFFLQNFELTLPVCLLLQSFTINDIEPVKTSIIAGFFPQNGCKFFLSLAFLPGLRLCVKL